MKATKYQKGFTVTELIIAVTISSIVIGVLFSATLNYYAKLAQAEISTEMALESQIALTQLIEDIKLATSIGDTNQITDLNAADGWTTDDTNNVIIINAPVTDSSHNIIYDETTGDAYRNEYVYFLDGTKFYKRILKNTLAPDNAATTTCPPPFATASCPPDKLFSDKTANFSFTFYDTNDVPTAIASEARSILFTVDMSKTIFGKTLTLSNSARVTFRNQ